MMIIRRAILGAALAVLAVSNGIAQTNLPPAALAAEAAGQWDEAIAGYEAVIASNPLRADLWIRIADIEAARHDLPASISALQRATRVLPANAMIFSKLSQAHAMAGQPAEALAAIEIAVSQAPDAEAYLRARATLATWTGDYPRARDSYRRIARINPDDVTVLVDYARVSAWDGATDEAAGLYRKYLKSKPEAADVWLELAKVESWRGNYAEANGLLEEHSARFGESAANVNQRAAVMASGGRPRAAEAAISPLLEQRPDDYQLNLTRTIALAMQERVGDASASLETVRRLEPNAAETRDAERVLRSVLASTADMRVGAYADSDHLRTRRFDPRVSMLIRTGTRLSGGYEQTRLDAELDSGLEQRDGTTSAQYQHGWAGVAQKIGFVTIGGQLGQARAEGRDLTTYALRTELFPRDGLRIAAERSSGFFVISPRTVGMGMTELAHRVALDVMPTLSFQVALEAVHRDLSDGNRRWEIAISPRHSIARTSRLNLDLGGSAYFVAAKFDRHNGYYDPRRYEQYAFGAYPYFKIQQNVGLGFTLAAGAQRDSSVGSFRFGGTIGGEATVGIYQPWVLKIGSSATLNRRLESGAYQGLGATIALVRRF